MARGSEIIVSTNPKGTWEECVISGTPKPGMVMEKKAATAKVGGVFTYQISSVAAGLKRPICVLLPDRYRGKLATEAYADGDRGFLYWPADGEELNMLLGDVGGTGDTVAIGDKFGVTTTGKIIRDSSYNTTPFESQEALSALTADTLVWCKYRGGYA